MIACNSYESDEFDVINCSSHYYGAPTVSDAGVLLSDNYGSHEKYPSPMQSLCDITQEQSYINILSFLDNKSVLRFGMTSKRNYCFSKHSSLWNVVDIQSHDMELKALIELVSRTSKCLPLEKINISLQPKEKVLISYHFFECDFYIT